MAFLWRDVYGGRCATWGLTDVRVLSGGVERWIKEGHVLTKEPTPLPAEPSVFNYELQTHMVMSRDEVLKASETVTMLSLMLVRRSVTMGLK